MSTWQRIQTLFLAVLALLQVLSAVVLMWWALPLFLDPPVLGNAINHASWKLRELSSKHPEELEYIG